MNIEVQLNADIEENDVLDIYRANHWSSADKPQQVMAALRNSHTLVTARINGRLVHPDVQGKGIGRLMMGKLLSFIVHWDSAVPGKPRRCGSTPEPSIKFSRKNMPAFKYKGFS